MAKLAPIFFFFLFSLVLLLHSTSSQPLSDNLDNDDEAQEYYVLDGPGRQLATRSMFLKKEMVKKGTQCNSNRRNINVCNGVYADKGASLLHCCKNHCRNVRTDRNNCGRCGQKCRLGELCCNSVCTRIAHNKSHCGKCNNKCARGVRCHYGTCGYA